MKVVIRVEALDSLDSLIAASCVYGIYTVRYGFRGDVWWRWRHDMNEWIIGLISWPEKSFCGIDKLASKSDTLDNTNQVKAVSSVCLQIITNIPTVFYAQHSIMYNWFQKLLLKLNTTYCNNPQTTSCISINENCVCPSNRHASVSKKGHSETQDFNTATKP